MSATAVSLHPTELQPGQCGKCHSLLPLRAPGDSRVESEWVCASCGSELVADCIQALLTPLGSKIRIRDSRFDTSDLPPISMALRRQVAKLCNRETPAEVANRRRSPRQAQSLVIAGIRIDECGAPIGHPINLMVVNLSREGIGLVHSDRLLHDRLAIRFPRRDCAPLQVLARVVRQQPLTYPFVEIGCEFIVRLGN